MIRVLHHINSIFSSVSYVLISDESRECWMVDVGDYEKLKPLISTFHLKGVLLTHTHFDHIYGLNQLLADYPEVPFYTNEFGYKSLNDPMENLSFFHDEPFVLLPNAKVLCLRDGDRINVWDKEIIVFETPGHDPSCLCFGIEGILFTGDAYIPGQKVFTKFQNSNKNDAEFSFQRIKKMVKNHKVFPGHIIELQRDFS